MRLLFALLLFIAVVTISTDTKAGVEIIPKYNEPQVDWIDPNTKAKNIGDTYESSNGLQCKNAVYQVYVGDLLVPARKCQLPDGAWQTCLY